MVDSVTFECPQCGNKQFEVPAGAQDDHEVTSPGCDRVTLLGDIRRRTLDQARQQAKEQAKDWLRKLTKGR